jgi:hypothetical protein
VVPDHVHPPSSRRFYDLCLLSASQGAGTWGVRLPTTPLVVARRILVASRLLPDDRVLILMSFLYC